MRASLQYGVRYRALVTVPATLRQVLTPTMLETELRRYQLFGRVSPTVQGYEVQAEFRGRSGQYDLPAEVTMLEIAG